MVHVGGQGRVLYYHACGQYMCYIASFSGIIERKENSEEERKLIEMTYINKFLYYEPSAD